MAVLLNSKRDTFEVILSIDSALDVSEEDLALYRETLDENHLKFKPEQQPTRFVMRRVLPFDLAKKIESEKISTVDGKMQIQLGFMAEEVRVSLVGIINPEYVPEADRIKFEKDKDGGASSKLMELLFAADVVNELYAARQLKVGKAAETLKKK